jgi:hypothetical protein
MYLCIYIVLHCRSPFPGDGHTSFAGSRTAEMSSVLGGAGSRTAWDPRFKSHGQQRSPSKTRPFVDVRSMSGLAPRADLRMSSLQVSDARSRPHLSSVPPACQLRTIGVYLTMITRRRTFQSCFKRQSDILFRQRGLGMLRSVEIVELVLPRPLVERRFIWKAVQENRQPPGQARGTPDTA